MRSSTCFLTPAFFTPVCKLWHFYIVHGHFRASASPSASAFLQCFLRSVFLPGSFTSLLLFSFPFFLRLLPRSAALFILQSMNHICLLLSHRWNPWEGAFSFSLKIWNSFQELKRGWFIQVCLYWRSLGLGLVVFFFWSYNPYPCTFIKLCRNTKGVTLVTGIVGVVTKQ